MIGQIVCSKAGRDKGYFMVVVKQEDKKLYLCDGKERPLTRPKLKNIKHISFTNTVLSEEEYRSNKSLRKSLAVYNSAAKGRN